MLIRVNILLKKLVFLGDSELVNCAHSEEVPGSNPGQTEEFASSLYSLVSSLESTNVLV